MPDLVYRVSQVDVFRAWADDPEAEGIDWLIRELTSKAETPDMKRGTAFHAALEKMGECETDRINSQGHTFIFDGDFEITNFQTKEIRRNKDYGGIIVSGKVDAISGHHILDHKAATWFDAERYFGKYQWRYYLDIFGADRFTWYVWEMEEADTDDDTRLFVVRDLHVLEQYRYPDLERDCRNLALKLKAFAKQYLGKPQPIVDQLEITEEDVLA